MIDSDHVSFGEHASPACGVISIVIVRESSLSFANVPVSPHSSDDVSVVPLVEIVPDGVLHSVEFASPGSNTSRSNATPGGDVSVVCIDIGSANAPESVSVSRIENHVA